MTPSKQAMLLTPIESDDADEDVPLTAYPDESEDTEESVKCAIRTQESRRACRKRGQQEGGLGRVRILVLVLSSAALSFSITDLFCESSRRSSGLPNAASRDASADPNPDAEWPRVAWLMSYPNSGTSYTLTLVRAATNTTTGSNYGKECSVDEQGLNVPIHTSLSDTGPCFHRASMEHPQRYVLTKTHCGGRCGWCPPDEYTETARSFLMQCASGSVLLPGAKKSVSEEEDAKEETDSGNRHLAAKAVEVHEKPKKGIGEGRTPNMVKLPSVKTTYDPAVVVQRAIHLIRDPFDNLVSRFHHEMGKHKLDPDFLDHYNSTVRSPKDNFRLWCQDHDDRYDAETAESRFVDPFLWQMERDIPCHNEFVKYIQWHNLAFEATNTLRTPTLILHYESYVSNFDETLHQILDFLDATPAVGPQDIPEFISNKQYRDFYDPDELRQAASLMQTLSSTETWQHIHHYFKNL